MNKIQKRRWALGLLFLLTMCAQLNAQSITSASSKNPHFENLTAIFTATGSPSGGTWAISGGNDASLVQVNSSSGAISFKSAPDYENPSDNGSNNVYDFTLSYTQGGTTVTQNVSVTVTNVYEIDNECPEIFKRNNGSTNSGPYVYPYAQHSLLYTKASGSLQMKFPMGTPGANIPAAMYYWSNGTKYLEPDFDNPRVKNTGATAYDSTLYYDDINYVFFASSNSSNLGTVNIITIVFSDSVAAQRQSRNTKTRSCTYDFSSTTPVSVPNAYFTTNLSTTGSACSGASKTLTIAASPGTNGNSLTYKWFKGTTAISGATSASYTISSVSSSSAGDYYCEVSESNGSYVTNTVNSNTLTLTVYSLPTISISPTSASITSGSGVSLTASGASTYAWSPSGSLSAASGATVTASPTTTTTYTVTGTDGNSCTNTGTVTVTVTVGLSGGIVAGNTSVCSGGDPAAFTSTSAASNGTGSYSYQWQESTNSGSTWTDITSATGTTYDVPSGITTTTQYRRKVSDGSNTAYSNTLTVTVNANPTISGTASVCAGSTTTLTGSGTAATSNPWVSATTSVATVTSSGVVTGAAAGTSVITYTDNNGCTATQTVTVNALPTVSISPSSATISSGSSQSLTASGASTYSWSPSTGLSAANVANPTASPTTTTTYTVTGTGANGCVSTQTVTITVTLDGGAISGSTSVCSGGDPAAFTSTSTASGGTGTYTYTWEKSTDGGSTWSTVSGATSTTYDVPSGITATTQYRRVTSDGSTTANSNALTVTVNANPTISGTASVCAGSTTTLTGTGTAASWSTSNSSVASISGSTSNTETVTGAAAGTATITYTDNNGCTATQTVTVNALPTVSISPSSATISSGSSQSLTASGASTYSWSPSTGLSAANVANPTASPTASTTYTVTGTDANGCVSTQTVTITVTLDGGAISGSTSVCSGGDPAAFTSTSTASGGTGTYTYTWEKSTDGGSTWSTVSGATSTTYDVPSGITVTTQYRRVTSDGSTTANSNALTVTVNANPTISGTASICGTGTTTLTGSGTASGSSPWVSASTGVATVSSIGVVTGVSAGTSVITYTDNNNCTATQTVTVYSSPTISVSPTSATIVQGNSQTLTASGGTSYSWSPATGLSATTGSPVTATPSSTTTYTVTGTDANGCTGTATSTITVTSSLSGGTVASNQTICSGATPSSFTSSVAASGGTGTLSYQWQSTSAGGSSWTDISGATSATYSFTSGLTSSTDYRRKVTDAASSVQYSNTVSITVNANPTATIASSTNVGCYGASTGSINLTASGTATLSYAWTGPNSYTATTEDISSLAAGTYNVTVTDGNSCTATTSATLTEPAAALSLANSSQTNVLCYGNSTGAVTVSATGGTSPYTYKIGSGAYGSSATFTGLAAGTYTITAQDANSCTQTLSVTITQLTAALSSSSVAITNVSCNGGSNGAANITVTGGTAPYTYAWSGPSSYSSTSEDITGLSAGTYTVVVTDASGCTSTNNSVSVTQPTALSASSVTVTNLTCNGSNDGSAASSPSGGTGTYTYSWSTGSTNASITGLSAGTYSVTVTDANGCTAVNASVVVTEPTAVSVTNSSQTNVLCNGNSTGAVTVSASGGSGSYTYQIGSGSFASSATFTGLSAGTYTITAKDGQGCTGTLSVTITQPAALSASVGTKTNVGCYGASTGSIGLDVTGGTTNYTYAWTGPNSYTATTEDISSLAAGTYNVTVTDANGCTATASTTLTEPAAALTISSTVTTTPVSCNGGSDGTADITVTGGTTPYTFAWIGTGSYTSSVEDPSNFAAGTYSVTVTDANGCTASKASISITEPAAATISSVSYTDPSCDLASDGTITITATGGNTLTYSIDSGTSYQSTGSFTGLTKGPYKIAVSDSKGCTVTNNASTNITLVNGDNTNPVASAKNVTVYLNASGSASINYTDMDNGSSDNCEIVDYELSDSTFDCSEVGSKTVTMTVTDKNGNSSSTTATVTVVDARSPIPSAQNVTVYLNASGNASISYSDINNGSSDNCGVDHYTLSDSTFDCSNVGANTVTLTVYDVNGNDSSVTATVTVVDARSPIPSAQNATVYLNASGNASISYSDINNGSSDNCGVDHYTLSDSTFDCSNVGANTVTLTVYDVNGNDSSVTATVTVVDARSPIPSAQNVTVYLNASGNASISYSDINNGSSDNCGVDHYTLSDSTFDCSNVGANTVTLTVYDVNGNDSSVTATVTVVDARSPIPSAQNVTVYLNASGNASISYSDINNGSSDNCGVDHYTLSDSTFDCSNVGANTVTLTVYDVNGNDSSVTATVTVVDNTNPTLSLNNVTKSLNASGAASITWSDIDNGSSDACGIQKFVLSDSTFDCNDTGVNVVTVTVYDVNGNTSTSTVNVTIQDVTNPTAITKNITVNLNASGSISITASDVNNGSNDNCGIKSLSVSPSSFICSDTGVNKVVLTAVDGSGNTDTAHAYVTVKDVTNPTAITKNITVNLNASGSISITASDVNNGSNDNCGIKSLSVSPSSFTCSDTGVNKVVLTAVDGSGNTDTAHAYVTVKDVTNPTAITKNITVNLNASGNISITASDVNNGSNDNCGIKSLSVSPSSFTCSDTGVNKVVLTAVDGSGNTDTAHAYVTVKDVTNPTAITQNISISLDATGAVSITAADVDNGSNDNCGIKSLSVSPSSFTCSDTGVNKVVLTAVDGSGNTDTAHAYVTVSDTTKPIVLTKNLVLALDANGQVSFTATDIDNGSNDNCGIKSLSVNPSSFSCADTGKFNVVTLTAVDGSGNTQTATATVRVFDTSAPTVKAQDITVYLDVNGVVSTNYTMINNGSFDNCSIREYNIVDSSFDCSDTGVHNLMLIATDYSGNSAFAAYNVTVLDTMKPVVVTKTHTVWLDTAAKASMVNVDVIASITDNCGTIDTLVSKYTFTLNDTGWVDVDVWVTDKNGNTTGPVPTRVLVLIRDSDNDSIPDYIEGSEDKDGDGVYDFMDLDSDNDGILDVVENEGKDYLLDLDSDGTPDYKDLDTDNDGIDDVIEVDGNDPDFDGIAGNGPAVVDANGVPTIANGGYAEVFTDADPQPDYKDLDTDDDGILDSVERGPSKDPVDTDSDGTRDWRDLDSDNDGISDQIETDIDTDGDGTGDWRDLDTDNDGISDQIETDVDTDGDGTGDWRDLDSDNDGISDQIETDRDTDGDGTGDWRDLDTDNDGLGDDIETDFDTDGDGVGDWRDLDVDNDGILDIVENEGQSTELDLDGDGTPNYKDLDTDDDTIDDIIEVDGSDPDLDGVAGTGAPVVDANGVPVIAAGGYAEIFTDADALPDYKDIDADEDGILDWIERGPTKFPVDTDSDGKGDWRDLDSDNDGISDEIETDIDTDGDGVGDWRDLDSDDDGISDEIETDVDTDGDGIGDWRDLDSDNDEVDDATEGTGDRDKNNIPDWRDPQVFIPEGFSPNGDGTNEVLYIKGLKNYPQAKLTVFNRWGQVVYESPRGYQNDWDGVYNGKTFSIGQGPLPENVYFLLFEFNGTGEPRFIKDPISGNLYIKR